LIKNVVKHKEVKTQILLMEPLPSINKVFLIVIQQERQLTNNIFTKNISIINLSRNQGNWKQKTQGHGRCHA